MDVTFSAEQEAYRRRAREWLLENLPKGWGTPDFRMPAEEPDLGNFLKNWERKLYEGGYAGITWPKAYGGQGLTFVEEIIFQEEMGKLNAPAGCNGLGKSLLGPTMLLHGTEEQKQRFLLPLLRGEEIWCQGFSEPNAGSDLAALQTRAELNGDEWVINGQKVWTSGAQYANWCFLLARTDQEAPKHKGITFFLVPMDAPGISVRPIKQMNKNKGFNEVFFDDVKIPKDSLIGAVNNGWNIAMSTLAFERGTLSLGRQARFQNEFDEMIRISSAMRSIDCYVIKDNPHYRQKMAKALAELRILRYHGLKLISQLINDGKAGPESSIHKLYWSTMYQRMCDLGVEILGSEAPYWGEESIGQGKLQFMDLSSRSGTIWGGTTQIQKNIIAERVLGMQR